MDKAPVVTVHRVGATHDGTGACICGEGNQLLEGCKVVAHTAGLHTVAFSPCGQRLASGGLDGAVILWDVRTGEAEQRMQGDAGVICSLSWSRDGAWLASGNGDDHIYVWDVPTGALLRTIPPSHKYFVLTVEFSPTESGRLSSGGGEIRLWNVDSSEMIRRFEGLRFAVFSPDGRTIATAGASARDVHLVNAESGALQVRMVGHEGIIFSVSFSLDGSKLASGCSDGTCKVWDSSTEALLRTIQAGTRVFSVVWVRDWVRDTQRGEAFAKGHHPRLGAGSQALELETGVVRMILDRV